MKSIREVWCTGYQEMSIQANPKPYEEGFEGGYQFRVNEQTFALLRWEVPQDQASAKTTEGLWSFKPASTRPRTTTIELTATSQQSCKIGLFRRAWWGAKGWLETTSNQAFHWRRKGNQSLWLSPVSSTVLLSFKPKVKAGQVITAVEVAAETFSLAEFPLLVVIGCYLLDYRY